MSSFREIERDQCPECRYMRRCPARKVLIEHPDDPQALVLMRNGTCSQFATKRRGKVGKWQ